MYLQRSIIFWGYLYFVFLSKLRDYIHLSENEFKKKLFYIFNIFIIKIEDVIYIINFKYYN